MGQPVNDVPKSWSNIYESSLSPTYIRASSPFSRRYIPSSLICALVSGIVGVVRDPSISCHISLSSVTPLGLGKTISLKSKESLLYLLKQAVDCHHPRINQHHSWWNRNIGHTTNPIWPIVYPPSTLQSRTFYQRWN